MKVNAMLVQFIRSHTGVFRTRSASRNEASDRAGVRQVADAIGDVLGRLESERRGLTRRVSDVLARAAITAGNGGDEYLTREASETAHLSEFENEIKRGQSRINELERNLGKLRTVQQVLEQEFPEYFRTGRLAAAE